MENIVYSWMNVITLLSKRTFGKFRTLFSRMIERAIWFITIREKHTFLFLINKYLTKTSIFLILFSVFINYFFRIDIYFDFLLLFWFLFSLVCFLLLFLFSFLVHLSFLDSSQNTGFLTHYQRFIILHFTNLLLFYFLLHLIILSFIIFLFLLFSIGFSNLFIYEVK